MPKKILTLISKYSISLFFLGFLLLGFSIFKDYGMSWDEFISRQNGLYSVRYVLDRNPALLTYYDRYYGTAFESFLVLIEKVLHYTDSQRVFFMRHLISFGLFYLSTIAMYLLLKIQTKSRQIAWIGTLFLILSPRIFADSFYNSKDLAFMSACVIGLYTMTKFHQSPNSRWVLFHALASAFLIDIRIIGIAIPALTCLFNYKKIKSLALYFIFMAIFTILFWPILWHNPIGEFIAALKTMSNFTPWQGQVLYMGKFISSTELPWHYLPVWMAITTPISLIILGLFGTVISLRKLSNPLPLLWFYTPLAYVLIRHPILYDGWRHFFFIYPAWILLCVTGLTSILSLKNIYLKTFPLFFISLDLFLVFLFMVKNHPYQNVYFNLFPGNLAKVKMNFEMDYWGLSLTEGYRYITQHDNSPIIKIFAPMAPGETSIATLPVSQQKRLIIDTKNPVGAKYMISNYRWHPKPFPFNITPVFERTISGVPIVSVFDISHINIVAN